MKRKNRNNIRQTYVSLHYVERELKHKIQRHLPESKGSLHYVERELKLVIFQHVEHYGHRRSITWSMD